MQEHRIFPRYGFSRRVELHGPGGETFAAESCDISVVGMGLLVARSVVVAMAQGGSILTTGDQFQLVLRGMADFPSIAEPKLDCRVKHIRRLSQEQYLVGALFTGLSAEQEQVLAALVERAAQPGAR